MYGSTGDLMMQVTIDFPIIADPKREVAIKCKVFYNPKSNNM